MKCLTLRGGWWWWCITELGKDIENRSWQTPYRGDVLIHISAYVPKFEYNEWFEWLKDKTQKGKIPFVNVPTYSQFSNLNGKIVGLAEITDCVSTSKSFWYGVAMKSSSDLPLKQYGFVLKNVRELSKPLRVKGTLGLWNLPRQYEVDVKRQLLK
jgi:hypothetical protein